MKLDSNMETDRLLRRFARRVTGKSVKDPERDTALQSGIERREGEGMPHLDVDELSAYAENVLPVASRARYTSHLSECDTCRELVTDLVLASGTAARLEANIAQHKAVPSRSWRDLLAAAFAPRVLRYAASVILVVGIAAIAFLLFSGRNSLRFPTDDSKPANLSVNRPPEGKTSNNDTPGLAGKTNSPSSSPTSGETPEVDVKSGATSEANKDASQSVPELPKTEREEMTAQPPAPVTAPSDSITEQRRAQRDEDSQAGSKQQAAAGANSVDKRKAQTEIDGADNTGRLAAESNARARANEPSNRGGADVAAAKAPATSSDKADARSGARRKSETPAKESRPSGAVMDDRGDSSNRAGAAEEKKVVSGKQFIRRDGAWVDVAYGSQATTNVKRGSDQYRALVADEPGIRTIATQLSGEVIVVWKGRAYRIR